MARSTLVTRRVGGAQRSQVLTARGGWILRAATRGGEVEETDRHTRAQRERRGREDIREEEDSQKIKPGLWDGLLGWEMPLLGANVNDHMDRQSPFNI